MNKCKAPFKRERKSTQLYKLKFELASRLNTNLRWLAVTLNTLNIFLKLRRRLKKTKRLSCKKKPKDAPNKFISSEILNKLSSVFDYSLEWKKRKLPQVTTSKLLLTCVLVQNAGLTQTTICHAPLLRSYHIVTYNVTQTLFNKNNG
jgi:hypothetical protein